MLGKTLRQYCETDSALTKEQKRIEGELEAFEKNIWGDQARKDSLDSIAKANINVKGKKARTNRNRRAGGTSSTVKKSSGKSSSRGGGSSAARVSVRRQRH